MDEPEENIMMTFPGEGVSVKMARANWSTGYMQAAIVAALLGELGYDVSDPADLELAPSNAFVAMANGEFDFWVNSWFPNHNQFLAGEMPDGSLVSEHLTTLGYEMPRSGVQGLITNKAFADANGVTTLDANNDFLAANPAVARLLELFTINPVDVTLQNVTYSLGENTEDDVKRHAAEWIADNRDQVDAWLAAARLVG